MNGRTLKTNLLLEHETSKLDWFAEPNTQEEFESTTAGQPPLVIDGTFRSREPKCQRYCIVASGHLPADIFAVCEWYSEVKQPGGLRFRFRQVPDRAKYCFINFIGVVRIDFDSDASSRSKDDRYTITQEQRSRLDEALQMTTPVRRGGKMTVAEQQQKEAQQKEEIENQARPRMNHIRPSNREASRGSSSSSSSSSAASTTTTTSSSSSSSSLSSSSSSNSRPTAGSDDDDDNEMEDRVFFLYFSKKWGKKFEPRQTQVTTKRSARNKHCCAPFLRA